MFHLALCYRVWTVTDVSEHIEMNLYEIKHIIIHHWDRLCLACLHSDSNVSFYPLQRYDFTQYILSVMYNIYTH